MFQQMLIRVYREEIEDGGGEEEKTEGKGDSPIHMATLRPSHLDHQRVDYEDVIHSPDYCLGLYQPSSILH